MPKLSHLLFNPLITEGSNVFIYEVTKATVSSTFSLLLQPSKTAVIAREITENLSKKLGGDKPSIGYISNFTIPAQGHSIPVRLYQDGQKDSIYSLLLYVHGGGWTRGSIESHDVLCRKLCKATGYKVLSVDYRLAPEHPYPAGLNDISTVYEWCLKESKTLGVNPLKIILAGDSAGGNLATAQTIKLQQEHKPLPKALLLFYPSLDLRIPLVSVNPYNMGYFLTRDSVNNFIRGYLQEKLPEAETNPLISPILHNDLANFPPVVMISAQCDPLQAEAELFVNRLEAAGRKVAYLSVPRVIHAFAQFFKLFPEAEESVAFAAKHLKELVDG